MMLGRILTTSSDNVGLPSGSDKKAETVAALALKAPTFFWTLSLKSFPPSFRVSVPEFN